MRGYGKHSDDERDLVPGAPILSFSFGSTRTFRVTKKTEGLSVFLVDVRESLGKGLTVRPIRNMVNHETNEVFFDNVEVPAENLIGDEGKGFSYILDGMNAERILIAAECVGDGTGLSIRPEITRVSALCSIARLDRTRASSSRLLRPTPTCERRT